MPILEVPVSGRGGCLFLRHFLQAGSFPKKFPGFSKSSHCFSVRNLFRRCFSESEWRPFFHQTRLARAVTSRLMTDAATEAAGLASAGVATARDVASVVATKGARRGCAAGMGQAGPPVEATQ